MSQPAAPPDPEKNDGTNPGMSGLRLVIVALAFGGFLAVPALGLFRSGKKISEKSNFTQNTGFPERLQIGGKAVPPTRTAPLKPPSSAGPDDRAGVDQALAALGSDSAAPREAPREGSAPSPEPQKDSTGPRRQKHAVLPVENPDQAVRQRVTRELIARIPRDTANQAGVMESGDRAAKPDYWIIVQPGETLEGISLRTGAIPGEIEALNGFGPGSRVEPGQILKIPAAAQGPVMKIPHREFPQPLPEAVVGKAFYPPSAPLPPLPPEPIALPPDTKPLESRDRR